VVSDIVRTLACSRGDACSTQPLQSARKLDTEKGEPAHSTRQHLYVARSSSGHGQQGMNEDEEGVGGRRAVSHHSDVLLGGKTYRPAYRLAGMAKTRSNATYQNGYCLLAVMILSSSYRSSLLVSTARHACTCMRRGEGSGGSGLMLMQAEESAGEVAHEIRKS